MSESAFKNPFDVIDEDEVEGSAQNISVLPQEIEQALKKISKRDSKTRSKGFQELVEYLKKSSKSEIESFNSLIRAPFSKIFCKFVFCVDKSTRIALSELSNLLITKSDPKTFLQPILKDFICSFLMSLFDPINEVSSLQRSTLETVFPSSGGKLKLLLEKFDGVIRNEMWQYAAGPQKFEEMKAILKDELEVTDEDYQYSVELVKSEIVGLMSLLGGFEDEKRMKALLFVTDKIFSTFRRCALYRFALKYREGWFIQLVSDLLMKENNPTALSVALDLLEKTDSEKYKSVLSSETFVFSFISSASLSEFKRFSAVFLAAISNVEKKDAFCNSFLRVCAANNIMNKERFVVYWKDLAGPLFASSSKRDFYLEKLLFPERNSRNLGALTTFTPLNAEETIKIVCEVFSADCLVEICCRFGPSRQSAFILSYLKSYDDLESVMSKLSLTDLQQKELIKFIPNEMMTRRLMENSDDLSASELIRMVQSCLSVEDAIKVLKSRKFNDWERMLKSAYITKKTIKAVLFQLEGFVEYAARQRHNKTIVACAFESEIEIFAHDSIDQNVLDEAVGEVEAFCLQSPLLRDSIFSLLDHPKIRKLLQCHPRELYESLCVQEDCAKFLSLGCEMEEFFPVWYFDEMISQYKNLPQTPEECILFEPEFRHADEFFEDLISFNFEKLDNRVKAAKCAFLNRIEKVNFEFSLDDLEKLNADEVFGMFCASKYLNDSRMLSSLNSFKDALIFHQIYRMKNVRDMNEYFDSLVFSSGSSKVHVAECLSLEPVLNVRSDILGGLFNGLIEAGEVKRALLVAAKHLIRSDLKDEFWQAQFRDQFKAILSKDDLGMLVASGFWGKIEHPENELLEDFREILKTSNSVGACRLIVQVCTWMKDDFNLEKMVDYFSSSSGRSLPRDLAMRNVYVRLYLDEQLVAASVKLKAADESSITLDEIREILFPFVLTDDAIILELFVSAAEGCKEDSRLYSAFAEVFQQRIVNVLKSLHLSNDDFTFDFTPRSFDENELWMHVLFRFSCLFPLVVGPSSGLGGRILKQREIERLKRQPTISVEENLETVLKPILSSTTQRVELRVKFADEIELLIGLKLGDAFPFEAVQVEGINKSGLSEAKWRSALLSLQTLLRSPTFSGNLIEVVKKWQQNALKLFQGLEECAVCYSVLHGSDKSLPGPACRQCKHKFHASCLYKWFKSSGNATCPLCRALF